MNTIKLAVLLGCLLLRPWRSNSAQRADLPGRGLLGQPEVFIKFREDLVDAEGHIFNGGTQKFLQGFVDGCVACLQKVLRT